MPAITFSSMSGVIAGAFHRKTNHKGIILIPRLINWMKKVEGTAGATTCYTVYETMVWWLEHTAQHLPKFG